MSSADNLRNTQVILKRRKLDPDIPRLLEPEEAIAALRYQVDQYDWELGAVARVKPDIPERALQQPMVFENRKCELRWQIPLFFVLAHMAGVAAVYDGGRIAALGRRDNVEMWKNCYLRARRSTDRNLVYRAIQLIRPTSSKAIVGDWRKRRIDLLMVQHAVVQRYPGFRIFPNARGAPEVCLQPQDYGWRKLGGVVWTENYYTSGQVFIDCKRK